MGVEKPVTFAVFVAVDRHHFHPDSAVDDAKKWHEIGDLLEHRSLERYPDLKVQP